MRAKFIYEKFSEETDPIEDLGIGGFKHIHTEEELKKRFPNAFRYSTFITYSIFDLNNDQKLFASAAHKVEGEKPHFIMDYDPTKFDIVSIYTLGEKNKHNVLWSQDIWNDI